MHLSLRPLRSLAALTLLAPFAGAQQRIDFSIDWRGPTIGDLATNTADPITEGDVLEVQGGLPRFGPLDAPDILFGGDVTGLSNFQSCQGHQPGTPCGVEIDAFSYGADAVFQPTPLARVRVAFSVDEFAFGDPFLPAPSVASERPFGESACDIFVDTGIPPGPLGPWASFGHTGFIDGDGQPSPSGAQYFGLGLQERTLPGQDLPNDGDNLDAFNVGPGPAAAGGRMFFSLDAGFPDPLSGATNTASAAFNQVCGGDVLVTDLVGGQLAMYAPSIVLGLDQFGLDTDDLDALILHENGTPGFQLPHGPYDWLANDRDQIVFSLRRGSATIGQPDSLFGAPIQEGDLLIPPIPGGASPFPAIFIAAEALGLRTTRNTVNLTYGDDIDGLDAGANPYNDCNNNGIEDSVDIAIGASSDNNMNGIPDECESPGTPFCFCGNLAPCSNPDAAAGCANSTGFGARLEGIGSSSIGADDLTLLVTELPPAQFGLVFMGDETGVSVPFGDGRVCVAAGSLGLHRFDALPHGPGGAVSLGPGIVAGACGQFPPAGCIEVGQTWGFQFWYRDPFAGPCGSGFNYSNAWRVTFTM